MSKRISQHMTHTRKRAADFRDAEDGSFIILSLFLFLAIILVGGIGVDILRHDYARVRLQNTSDAAALAATDLDQTLDSTVVVKSHFKAAGIDGTLQSVSVSPAAVNRRSVAVSASADVNTWFMRAIGVDRMKASTGGAALEEVQDVEISLVLDVSGSMGEGNRLPQLKTAAKKFIDSMLLDRDGTAITGEISVNIVPYAAQVTLDDHVLSKLSLAQEHGFSNCLEFRGNQFNTTALTGIGPIVQAAHVDGFTKAETFGEQIVRSNYLDCSIYSNQRVTFMEDDIQTLKNKIDSLVPNGNTSTEFGLKVGVGLLDPSARPVLASHPDVENGPFGGRPYEYDRTNTLKVVVVMSDGQNTYHQRFADGYEGDTISDTWAIRSDGRYYFTVADQERRNVDGDSEYYEPGYYPYYNSFGYYVLGGQNAQRLSWQDVFARVNLHWHAKYARGQQAGRRDDYRNPKTVENEWMNRVIQSVGPTQKDKDTAAICNAAKAKGILIYSIAFEISREEATLLRSCATNENMHYNVSGNELNYAFSSIATSLNSLQLVQ